MERNELFEISLFNNGMFIESLDVDEQPATDGLVFTCINESEATSMHLDREEVTKLFGVLQKWLNKEEIKKESILIRW